MTGQHLTDEQFTDLLSGDYTADASRHVMACAQCQGGRRWAKLDRGLRDP